MIYQITTQLQGDKEAFYLSRVCCISANCYYVNYFSGYGGVNVRVYIDGWHKQVM